MLIILCNEYLAPKHQSVFGDKLAAGGILFVVTLTSRLDGNKNYLWLLVSNSDNIRFCLEEGIDCTLSKVTSRNLQFFAPIYEK